jgi:hypothetical protein
MNEGNNRMKKNRPHFPKIPLQRFLKKTRGGVQEP